MANRQLQAVKTRIGTGSKVVTFKYKSVIFGPVFAKTDNELNQILEFCKYKKKEYEFKESNSKDYLMPLEAYQAMISLPTDVVSYINCSFAKIAGEKHVKTTDFSDISSKDETSFNEKQSEKQSEKNMLEPNLENERSECPTKLKKHFKTVHEKRKPENCLNFTEIAKENIKPNKCFNCQRTFVEEIEFRKHIFSCQQEILESSFNCLWCNFSSNFKWKLQKHILRVHDKNYPFKCAFCPEKFGLQSSLKIHFTRLHKNEKKSSLKYYV